MGKLQVHRPTVVGWPPGRRAVILVVAALVLLGAAPSVVMAAPTPHPYTGNDVTQCWGCHAGKYTQWQNSSPYTRGSYGTLQGHNVNAAGALLNVGHNTEEPLVNDCQHCMTPFSTRTFNGTALVDIGTYVQPLNRIGPWQLVSPYLETMSVTGPRQGFYYPADHTGDTTHGAYEGISCRTCHDVTHLDPTTGLPTLAWFNGDTWSYEPVDPAQPNLLCEKCHNSDDSRSAPDQSVHAGLNCIDCHMKAANGAVNADHSLNAGHFGDTLAQSSCGQATCHDTALPAGHPPILGLNTSFKDPATYAADPTMIKLSADVQHNIHFITCDTCHQPSGVPSSYTVVYAAGGKTINVRGSRTGKTLPGSSDSGTVSLFVWPAGLDPVTDSGGDFITTVGAPDAAPGSAFTVSTPALSENATLLVTQAALDADHVFPGVGRGSVAHVWVKVAAKLTASRTKVHPRGRVKFTAMIAPDKTGAKVLFQLSRNGKSWKTWRSLALGANSTKSVVWKAPAKKGKYFFRVKYAGDDVNVGNVSTKKTITVF
jgi:hypothetical protein